MDTQHRKEDPILVQVLAEPIDGRVLEAARAVKDAYAAQGVILDGELGEGCFLTSDELSRVRFSFRNIPEENYNRLWADYFDLPFETFLLYLQCSVLLLLGKRILASLRCLILDFKTIISLGPSADASKLREKPLTHPHLAADILQSLPVPDRNYSARENLVEEIESSALPCRGSQRELPDFKSILTFGAILDDFWNHASPDKKLFYFPVCLWWKITCVLPTRPREFLVTPRKCVYLDESGEWKLALRKNLIKGSGRLIHYKIAQDYEERTYPVPAPLAGLITEYVAMTACYHPTELDTLLIPDPHYLLNGRSKNKRSRYYTYANLRCALRLFLQDIVHGEYGYAVIDERDAEERAGDTRPGQDRVIQALQLGDTRHISLVNMIAEGVQPLAAMELAAHDNPKQTFHYAANLETYLQCATYRAYMDRTYTRSMYSFNAAAAVRQFNEDSPYEELDDGFCYSERFLKGSAEDCVRAFGPHSELGWCQRCPWFRSKTPALIIPDTSRYLLDVKEDWALLTETIDTYRRDVLGKDEELFQVLLRAQASLNIYQNALLEDVKKRRAEHGEA